MVYVYVAQLDERDKQNVKIIVCNNTLGIKTIVVFFVFMFTAQAYYSCP